MTRSSLLVLVTPGKEDPDRALLGLNTALVGASSGVDVTVFFTLRGTQWACAAQPATPITDEVMAVLGALEESGARLECCSACLDKHCVEAARSPRSGLREGVELVGLASMVQQSMAADATLSF